MSRHTFPVSDAREKGGIAGGTVGAVLMVAMLTMFCYRRSRRRIRDRKSFSRLSDSSSDSDAAERGMVALGGLPGSEKTTTSAAGGLAASEPQTPDRAPVDTTEVNHTSEQVPICFRPSRCPTSQYPNILVTPRVSIRPSDYLNPIVRETLLLPRPLRLAGRPTIARSLSWQAGPRQPPAHEDMADHRASPDRSRRTFGGTSMSRSRSMTAAGSNSSSVYSSDQTVNFGEYAAGDGVRTSRATTAQRGSGTTDASGLRSTLANFPRPPPYTFSRGHGRGLGTSWRESFVFSPPEDEVLLAFPQLARQMGDETT